MLKFSKVEKKEQATWNITIENEGRDRKYTIYRERNSQADLTSKSAHPKLHRSKSADRADSGDLISRNEYTQLIRHAFANEKAKLVAPSAEEKYQLAFKREYEHLKEKHRNRGSTFYELPMREPKNLHHLNNLFHDKPTCFVVGKVERKKKPSSPISPPLDIPELTAIDVEEQFSPPEKSERNSRLQLISTSEALYGMPPGNCRKNSDNYDENRLKRPVRNLQSESRLLRLRGFMGFMKTHKSCDDLPSFDSFNKTNKADSKEISTVSMQLNFGSNESCQPMPERPSNDLSKSMEQISEVSKKCSDTTSECLYDRRRKSTGQTQRVSKNHSKNTFGSRSNEFSLLPKSKLQMMNPSNNNSLISSESEARTGDLSKSRDLVKNISKEVFENINEIDKGTPPHLIETVGDCSLSNIASKDSLDYQKHSDETHVKQYQQQQNQPLELEKEKKREHLSVEQQAEEIQTQEQPEKELTQKRDLHHRKKHRRSHPKSDSNLRSKSTSALINQSKDSPKPSVHKRRHRSDPSPKSKHRSKTRISCLKATLLLKIFSYLPTRDICRISRVCQNWYHLYLSPQLWHSLVIPNYLRDNIDDVLGILLDRLASANAYACIQIRCIQLNKSTNLTDKGLNNISMRCLGLKSLNIENCVQVTGKGLGAILAYCPNMAFLNLSGCEGLVHFEFPANHGISFGKHASFLELRYLDLSECKLLMDNSLRLILNCASFLECLHLRNCDSISNCGLEAIAQYCSKLKELRMDGCSNVTDKFVQTISSSCLELESISLAECNITDNSIESIALNCKMLRHLNIRGCGSVTDRGVAFLTECHPTLLSLNEARCK